MKVAAAHLVIGVVLAVIASASGSRGRSIVEELFAGGVIGGQILLLASWLGFSTSPLLSKLGGFSAGATLISVVASICGSQGASRWNTEMSLIVAVSVLLMTGLFVLSRLFLLRPTTSTCETNQAKDLQFSTRSLLLLTTSIAIAIALGRTVRTMGGEMLGAGVLILCIVVFGTLAMLALLWAGLGIASPSFRLLISMVFTSLLGLFPPLFIGGPLWRYYTWPLLTTFVAIVVASTLLVIRAGGIRLVRVDCWLTDALMPVRVSE